MEPFRPLSTSDQLAQHLRREILKGSISGVFPGVKQLVQTLGVNSVAVAKAIKQLEHEGLVVHHGDRRSRTIAKGARPRNSALRVGFLHYDASSSWNQDSLALKQGLTHAGHTVLEASKSMLELDMDPKRALRLADSMEVDAWIIFSGSSEILDAFGRRELPAFAFHGRLDHGNLAGFGVRKAPVIAELVRKLVNWGHSRITLLAREERRVPHRGVLEQCFIDELKSHGIQTGPFNLPDWQDNPAGLEKVIDSLFKLTPPTALIIGDANLFHAAQLHLAQRGIFAPKQISLFCNDSEQAFHWVKPDIAHARWDHRPALRRVIQWANHVARGKDDRKQTYIRAELYAGGTLGPAPRP